MTLLNVTVYTTLVYVASPSPLNHFAQPMSNPQHFFLPKITFISTSLNGCPSANQSATGKRCPQALSNGPLCLARFWDKGTLHLFHHVGRQMCLYTRLFFLMLGWRCERSGACGVSAVVRRQNLITGTGRGSHVAVTVTAPLAPNHPPSFTKYYSTLLQPFIQVLPPTWTLSKIFSCVPEGLTYPAQLSPYHHTTTAYVSGRISVIAKTTR